MDRFDEMRAKGKKPKGNLAITENGSYDVSDYASVGVAIENESGSGDYNVFVQNSEPTSKDGVWMKTSSKNVSGVHFINDFSQMSEPVECDMPYLETTTNVEWQVIVGNYLYSFREADGKSYVYDLDKDEVKCLLPDVPAVNTSRWQNIIYHPDTNRIFLFYANDTYNMYWFIYDINSGEYIQDTNFKLYERGAGTDRIMLRIDSDNMINFHHFYTTGSTDYTRCKTIDASTGLLAGKGTVLCSIQNARNGNYYSGSWAYFQNGKCYYTYYYCWGSPYTSYLEIIDIETKEKITKTIKTYPSGTCSIKTIGAYGKYVFLINPTSSDSSEYIIYDMEKDEIKTYNADFYICKNYSLAGNAALLDELRGRIIVRTGNSRIWSISLSNENIENYENNSAVILQKLNYFRPVKILDNSNIKIGVQNAFIKENDGIKEYLTYYGDGKEWNLLKNPTNETTVVQFNSDGGSNVETQSVIIGGVCTIPEPPTKFEHTFDKWYLGDEPFDFTTRIIRTTSLTAHWIPNYYVSFNSEDGSDVSTQEITQGLVATIPEPPTKEGYEFKCWNLGDEEYDFTTPITTNITLTAQWLPIYSVQFNSNGGSNVELQRVTQGRTAYMPDDPELDGMALDCWLLNGEPYDFNEPVMDNITLTAKWVYYVVFNSDGGSDLEIQYAEYNQATSQPINPSKAGYGFVEWTLNGEPYDFSTPITSSIELVATWTEYTYYDMTLSEINKGTFRHVSSGSHTVVSGTGYDGTDCITIVGRGSTSPRTSLDQVNTFNYMLDLTSIGEISFYAKKNANHGNIEVCLDDINTKLIGIGYGSLGTDWVRYTLDVSRFTGVHNLVFVGGYIDSTGNSSSSTSYSDIKFGTLEDMVTVSFNTDGGSVINSITAISGNRIFEPSIPEKEEFDFDYWTLNGEQFDFSTPITSNTELVAKYTIITVPEKYQRVEYLQSSGSQYIKTNFTDTNGIIIDTKCMDNTLPTSSATWQSVISSENSSSPYNTQGIRINYSAANGVTINNSAIPAVANTLYTIHYDSRNNIDCFIINGRASKLALTTTTRASHHLYMFANSSAGSVGQQFKGRIYYLKIKNSTGELVRYFIPCYRKSDNVAGMYDIVNDVFYTNAGSGTFAIGDLVPTKTVQITFDTDGGSEVLPKEVVYGQRASRLPTPTKEGLYFDYWALDGERFDISTRLMEDIELVAVYTDTQTQVINYTMLYDNGDECEDITGGWRYYPVGDVWDKHHNFTNYTFAKEENRIYLYGKGQSTSYNDKGAAMTTTSIDSSGYNAVFIKSTRGTMGTNCSASAMSFVYGDLMTSSANKESLGGLHSQSGNNPIVVSDKTKDNDVFGIVIVSAGYAKDVSVYLNAFALLKPDNWEELASIAEITASSIADVLTNSSTLLNNVDAVNYMVANCTGDFMAKALNNSTFKTALNSSPYASIIRDNVHWAKFMDMVGV